MKGCVIKKFIDNALIALKYKFLNEKSELKKAALIFLFSKIFFTDETGNLTKLRVNGEEWQVFKTFLDTVNCEDIRLMMYHLYTEKFFRFTIKCKKLALEFGSPENAREYEVIDSNQSRHFWKEVSDELTRMELTDIVELKQLSKLRDKALEPFEDLLPEKVSIDEAIDNFMIIKECVINMSEERPKKTSRKEVIQSCRDFINQPGSNESSSAIRSIIENVGELSESDFNMPYKSTRPKLVKKRAPRMNTKPPKEVIKDDDDDDSEASENELREMNKRIGVSSQKMLQGIGTIGIFSEKLKKAYE